MGGVVHFEIPADNNERANTFYQSAFGWTLRPMEGMEYTAAITAPTNEDTGAPNEPGAINGALFPRTDALKTPILTIDVDNLDTALERVESAGGSVVQAKDAIPTMGWYAYFKDTEGNVLGVWQNDTSAGT
ncbi:VOC family protein [Arthrobacter sp. ISL-95]|uniref:VOC family protein n=1 Tax=Arthrobacter sp. ISL-95 TaxID=2819116 RepID=UPI001BE63E51|nr:VOC family protein [Arthrobacter sp. ISL-95]MBT2585753.1 VOC family protein [Arthrobacter sp. ISL-95]